MVTETLLPIMDSGDTPALIRHLIGLPLVLFGVYCIIKGGGAIIRASFGVVSDEDIMKLSQKVNTSTERAIKREGRWYFTKLFVRKWTPGALWMLGGFVAFAIAGYLMNQ